MAVSYDQINGWYNQYLGRNASQQEAANWNNGTYGSTDPNGIQQQISTSGEAQAYSQQRQPQNNVNTSLGQPSPSAVSTWQPRSPASPIQQPTPDQSQQMLPATLWRDYQSAGMQPPQARTSTIPATSPGQQQRTDPLQQSLNTVLYKAQNTPTQGSADPGVTGNLSDPNYRSQLISYWASQPGTDPSLRNDPGYWDSRMSQVGGDPNYWIARFKMTPGLGDSGGSGPASSAQAGTGFGSPAYQQLTDLANQMINRLNTPYSSPQIDQLQQMLQTGEANSRQYAQTLADQLNQRAGQLQTPIQTTALTAQQHALASNQLIAQRDNAIKAMQANFAGRGIDPKSQLAQDQINQIQQQYSNQQAQIDAQLQLSQTNTNEQRLNEATTLQGLAAQALQGGSTTGIQEQAQAADIANQVYQIQQQQGLQQLAAAQIPVSLENQGVTNTLNALAPSNPTNTLSALTGLLGPALMEQQFSANQNNGQNALIGWLLQSGMLNG